MKKGVIWIFFLVIFSQLVLALDTKTKSLGGFLGSLFTDIGSLFIDLLNLLFGTSEYSILFLKLMLVIIIATALYRPALNIFQHQKVSLLITILIGFIGVRFMPESTITFLGRYIMIAVIAALPWFLGRFFLPSGWPQTIFIIASYGVMAYFLLNFSSYSGYLPELGKVGGGAEIFTDLVYMFEHYALFIIILFVIIAVIALFIRFRDPTSRRSWWRRRGSGDADGNGPDGAGSDGATPDGRPSRSRSRSILSYLFVLALAALGAFFVFSGNYYWAGAVALALVAYFLLTSGRPYAQRSRAGARRHWWKWVLGILILLGAYFTVVQGQYWLTVVLLTVLLLIYWLGKPKPGVRAVVPYSWGQRIWALIFGFGIAFALTYFGIIYFGYLYGILAGAGWVLILFIYYVIRGRTGFRTITATRAHLRTRWLWWILTPLTLAGSVLLTIYIGWWAGAIGLGLLILIWLSTSPKASTARGHVGTAGTHLRSRWLWYLAGIITLVASFAVTYYIGWWAGAIGLGLLILIWLFSSSRTSAGAVRGHFHARWLWWIVGFVTLITAFSLTYFVHWTFGVAGLALLIVIWFMISSREGVRSARTHSQGHLLFIIFAIIMIILTVINFMVPDPIPWIDEILMVGLDIYLIIKGID
ncbi:MAG: hypothetical protein ABIF40_03775 [archaeon]